MLDAAIYCHQVWCCSRVQPMAFLCQNARSWLLCCNDTSADLLLQGLDVDTVLQDGKYYFWTSLCVLQRVCITQGRGSLHPGALWVELPQWVFWSGFKPRELQMKYPVIPGHACSSAVWSLVIYKEKPNRNSSCIIGFGNACVKLSCVRLARYFLPAGVDFPLFLPPFLLALLFKFAVDFWEPVQIWTEK